jgi:hypothetical protein
MVQRETFATEFLEVRIIKHPTSLSFLILMTHLVREEFCCKGPEHYPTAALSLSPMEPSGLVSPERCWGPGHGSRRNLSNVQPNWIKDPQWIKKGLCIYPAKPRQKAVKELERSGLDLNLNHELIIREK